MNLLLEWTVFDPLGTLEARTVPPGTFVHDLAWQPVRFDAEHTAPARKLRIPRDEKMAAPQAIRRASGKLQKPLSHDLGVYRKCRLYLQDGLPAVH
jgi:hypothetical protein